jgi:predicted DNA-binding protein
MSKMVGIRMDEGLWSRVKAHAKTEGKSGAEVVTELMTSYVEMERDGAVGEAQGRVRSSVKAVRATAKAAPAARNVVVAGHVVVRVTCRRCGHGRAQHTLGAGGTRCDCMTCPGFVEA